MNGGSLGHPFAGMLWMAAASALFAAMNVFARLASASLPWPEVAAARTVVAVLVAVSVAYARRAPLTVRDRPMAWARSLAGTASMLCVFYALGAPQIALGDVVTLGSLTPIFIALLSPWLLGERSGRAVWIATLVATAGVALVAGPQLRIAGHLAVIATLGSFCSALAMIFLRKLRVGPADAARPGESPEAIVVHFSVVSSVVMLALTVPVWRAPDARGAALLLGTGLSGGLAQLAMTRAYALDRAARLGTVGYLGVVLSHLFGAIVLGERPGPSQALGTLLVIVAGLMLGLVALRDARLADRRAASADG